MLVAIAVLLICGVIFIKTQPKKTMSLDELFEEDL